jgi:hypothetical protein
MRLLQPLFGVSLIQIAKNKKIWKPDLKDFLLLKSYSTCIETILLPRDKPF